MLTLTSINVVQFAILVVAEVVVVSHESDKPCCHFFLCDNTIAVFVAIVDAFLNCRLLDGI